MFQRTVSHKNLECYVRETQKIGCDQAGDDKNKHQYLRNQQTKRIGISEFNSNDHYIYYCGQESLRRNGVALIVSKRV